METGDILGIGLPKGCIAEKTHYGPDTVAIFYADTDGKTGIVSICMAEECAVKYEGNFL